MIYSITFDMDKIGELLPDLPKEQVVYDSLRGFAKAIRESRTLPVAAITLNIGDEKHHIGQISQHSNEEIAFVEMKMSGVKPS